MFYLVATNAKDLEPKDKDKCLKSRNKFADPKPDGTGPEAASLAPGLLGAYM